MYKCMKCDRWVTKWGLYKVDVGIYSDGKLCKRKKVCKRCVRKEIKNKLREMKARIRDSYPSLK